MTVFFAFLILVGCAGCAVCCAGFVQGFEFCNRLNLQEKYHFVQAVQAKREIFLACACWRGRVHARVYTRTILSKPCTPCTNIYNLLKKREKVYLKTLHKLCTNPAQGLHSF